MNTYFTIWLLIGITLIIIAVIFPLFAMILPVFAFLYYKLQRYYRGAALELNRLQDISRSPIYQVGWWVRGGDAPLCAGLTVAAARVCVCVCVWPALWREHRGCPHAACLQAHAHRPRADERTHGRQTPSVPVARDHAGVAQHPHRCPGRLRGGADLCHAHCRPGRRGPWPGWVRVRVQLPGVRCVRLLRRTGDVAGGEDEPRGPRAGVHQRPSTARRRRCRCGPL